MKKLILLLLIILNSFGYSEEELDRLIGIRLYINDFRRYARGKEREMGEKEFKKYRSIDEKIILEHMLKRYKQPKWILSQTGRGIRSFYHSHFFRLFYRNYTRLSETKRLEIKKTIWGYFKYCWDNKVNGSIGYKGLFYIDLPEVKVFLGKELEKVELRIQGYEKKWGVNRLNFYKEYELTKNKFIHSLKKGYKWWKKKDLKEEFLKEGKALADVKKLREKFSEMWNSNGTVEEHSAISRTLQTLDSFDKVLTRLKNGKYIFGDEFIDIRISDYTESQREKIIDALISNFHKPSAYNRERVSNKSKIKGLDYNNKAILFLLSNKRLYDFVVECTKSENLEVVKRANYWLKEYKELQSKK